MDTRKRIKQLKSGKEGTPGHGDILVSPCGLLGRGGEDTGSDQRRKEKELTWSMKGRSSRKGTNMGEGLCERTSFKKPTEKDVTVEFTGEESLRKELGVKLHR